MEIGRFEKRIALSKKKPPLVFILLAATNNFSLQKHKEELHTAKISLIIVALFMTCWMPFHVINLLMRVQLTNVKGQLISKANLKFSFEPKTEAKYFCIPALAL